MFQKRLGSNIQYSGIKNFCPRDIFWLGFVETFCLLGYGNVFSPKFIKVLNYIKSLCITFYAKFIKFFETFWPKKSDKKIHTPFSVPKFFNLLVLYTTDAHFYNPSVKIDFVSFFSSSDTHKFLHLLGCHAIGINSSLIFF